jgi:mRNA interferase MazF
VGRHRLDVVKRFDVHLVALGAAPATPRPCVVVSPDEMNRYLPTVIVAPLTTRQTDFPTRIRVTFKFRIGQIALEQLRVVEKSRLERRLGKLGDNTRREVLSVLGEMFAE